MPHDVSEAEDSTQQPKHRPPVDIIWPAAVSLTMLESWDVTSGCIGGQELGGCNHVFSRSNSFYSQQQKFAVEMEPTDVKAARLAKPNLGVAFGLHVLRTPFSALDEVGSWNRGDAFMPFAPRGLQGEPAMARSTAPSTRTSPLVATSKSIVIMFYNVWFREDVEVVGRMAAIGQLIEQHRPHVICLQEVTLGIYQILREASWWERYQCSVSESFASQKRYFAMQLSRVPVKAYRRNAFSNSVMERDLCIAEIDAGNKKKLVVATSHLESPFSGQMYSERRVLQARIAFKHLEDIPNVVFGGDMNWTDDGDGPPPLPHGWSDAWLQLKPQEAGNTFDSQANPMISGAFSQRLDRIFCHLTDFRLEDIQIVGTEAISGLTFQKAEEKQTSTVDVFPSAHFGLVLKIRYEVMNEPPRAAPRRGSFLCCCQAQ